MAIAGLVGVAVPRNLRSGSLPLLGGIGGTTFVLAAHLRRGGLRPSRLDLGVLSTVFLTLCGFGRRATDAPFFAPIAPSVDAAHHGAMVAWIAKHGRLPSRVVPELRQFSEYFLFTHRVIGDGAVLSGLAPMRAMGLFGLFSLVGVLATAGSLALLMRPASGIQQILLFSLVFVFGILCREYVIDIIFRSYFLAQLAALWLGLAACVCMAKESFRFAVPLLGGASMACYPLQTPLMPMIVVGVWFVTRDEKWMHRLLRMLCIGIGGLLVQAPYLAGALRMSREEGSVTRLSLRSMGGPVVLVFAACGVLHLGNTFWKKRFRSDDAIVAALVLSVGILSTIVIHLAFVVGGALGIVSEYSAAKVLFMCAPYFLILAALGGISVVQAVIKVLTISPKVFSLACLLSTLVLLPLFGRSRTWELRAPMNRDAYELAIHLPANVDGADVGVVGRGLSPYFLAWTGIFAPTSYARLADRNPWLRWPTETTQQYLLVSGNDFIEAIRKRPGVTTVRRQGTAALFRRAP